MRLYIIAMKLEIIIGCVFGFIRNYNDDVKIENNY